MIGDEIEAGNGSGDGGFQTTHSEDAGKRSLSSSN